MGSMVCPACGKVVKAGKGNRCPECNSFLHPDPLKRREAEMADMFRDLLRDLSQHEWLRATDYHLPPPSELDEMTLDRLYGEVNKITTE